MLEKRLLQNKRIKSLRTSISILFLFILFPFCSVFAQIPDSVSINVDSLLQQQDTLPPLADSSKVQLPYLLSDDAIDGEVDRKAEDSTFFDFKNKKYYLYGKAEVNYQTINLKAGFIMLDFENDLIVAKPHPDSTGRLADFPTFTDGEQEFSADSIKYNYKTEKGKVYNMRTQQQDIYIIGSQTKFIRGKGPDTARNDIVNTASAIFTTCTHPQPHFGIRSNKVKIIPNKLAVVGPSQLELMGVPTPLWFPFGFIPLKQGRRTGLIFPNDYEYSPQLGFGLRGIGWFFPMGDHVNLTLTSDVYLKGTYGFNVLSTYRKNYKYSGNLNFGYNSQKIENSSDGTSSRINSFNIRFSHTQDRRAHPTNNFGGSVNIQTNNFQNRLLNDAASVTNSQLSSNLNFTKNWSDKPLTLSVGFNHTQNTQSRLMTINFPNVRFLTQSIYPFKKPGGKPTWYENTVVQYNGELKTRIQTPDSLLLSQETLDNIQTGAKHNITLSNSFKILKNFNFNPSFNYQEVQYLQTIDRTFDPTQEFSVDTIFNADSTAFVIDTTFTSFGSVATDTVGGFSAYRTFNLGASVNTRLFFTYENSKGFLRGLRWEMRPTISFNYSPNYLNTNSFREVQTDTRFPEDLDIYSIYEGSIFGGPPQQEEQMAIGYSFNNIFQAKTWSKRDSSLKKLKLIDNIIVSGRYNFAADSLKWSQVAMRTTTRLFKGITTVGFSATFDPYIKDEFNRRIDEWTGFRGILPFRFDNATLRFNSNLTVGKIRALFQGKDEEVVTDLRQNRGRGNNQNQEEDFLSLFENFRIAHNMVLRWTTDSEGKATSEVTTHAVNFQGRVNLTKNWGVNIGNFGYDFVRQGLSYPSFGITRDLHCWQMTLDLAPTRGTFRFSIQVKPGTLDFINLPYQRNNVDGFNAFR